MLRTSIFTAPAVAAGIALSAAVGVPASHSTPPPPGSPTSGRPTGTGLLDVLLRCTGEASLPS